MKRSMYVAVLVGVLWASVLDTRAQSPRPGIVWQHSYGGSYIDIPLAVRHTRDGGFVVAGGSQSSDGTVALHHGDQNLRDYFILKVDDSGRFVWKQVLGGGGEDFATDVRETIDGGYIVAGYSSSTDADVMGHHGNNLTSDAWIVKLDGSGAVQWKHSYGGTDNDRAYRIEQTADGGYIVAGSSASTDGDVTANQGAVDCWIFKIDANGVLRWQRTIGGGALDIAYCIHQTNDLGYVVAASTMSSNGDVTSNFAAEDYWVVKLDSLGQTIWQRTYGGSGDDEPYYIIQASDGGYAVAGYSNSTDHDVTGNHGQEDMWILRLNPDGSIKWQTSLGGGGIESAYSIIEMADSSLAVVGYTTSADGEVTDPLGGYDVWFVRLRGADGSLREQRTFGGKGDEFGYGLDALNDSTFVIAAASNSQDGDISSPLGFDDYWLLEIGPVHENRVYPSPISRTRGMAYPNPFEYRTTILLAEKLTSGAELRLYSATGQEVRRIDIPSESDRVMLDRGDLVAGAYGYRITSEGRILQSGSVIVR